MTGSDLRNEVCTELACLSADACVDGIGASIANADTECVGGGCSTLFGDAYLLKLVALPTAYAGGYDANPESVGATV